MRKIFILGGSSLQLDLILEAKKMFFYTIVLDMDLDCIGAKWCDEFLHIDISNKELVLEKAQEYAIEFILTSSTELGNVTACFVGEKLGLNTNSYLTALNTTNKIFMKKILNEYKLPTAKYTVLNKNEKNVWNTFPCIIKPSDSSAGRGLSYCTNQNELNIALPKASMYSATNDVLIEEYIEGKQFSIETISSNGQHQILAINYESIKKPPNIIEASHTIPADIDEDLQKKINKITLNILDSFNIQYGAAHIEIKITQENEIYIIELASRTGGMRSEMINLAYGISYSQLLLLSAMNKLSEIEYSRSDKVTCNFIIDEVAYKTYLQNKDNKTVSIFEPFEIPNIKGNFNAKNLGESKGYYFILN